MLYQTSLFSDELPVQQSTQTAISCTTDKRNKTHDPETGQFSSPLKIAEGKVKRLLLQISVMRINHRIWADKKEKRIAELEKRLSKYETV